MGQRFAGALTKDDLFNASTLAAGTTLTLIAGQYNKIGQRVIEAGERIEIGFGALSGMDNAVGRIQIKMMDNTADTPVEIKGKLRLTCITPQNRFLETVFELRTEQANAGTSDRSKWRPLPEQNVVLTEDKKYVLEFWPDAAATLSKTNSELIIDVTIDEQ